ncbi:unnamed protein product [Somion occarium]|uniref:Extracellular serine-rich protein n=1 Tax=Somion occarium TaxID=3059160 RepID=A0ABP1ECX9_9APHY
MLVSAVVFAGLLGLVQAATYTVTVGIDETDGQPGLGFDPTTIRPAVGDTITFTFQLPGYIKNPSVSQHSATQSTFDNPCTPKEGGFDTGVQSTGSANSNTGSSFDLLVNDTEPLWFFSAANQDCKSGMVLSVNPPITGEQTAAAFVDKAKASTGTPSSPPPSSSASGTSGSGASQTSDSSAPPPSPTATEPSSTNDTSAAVSGMAKMEVVFAGVVAFMGLSLAA